MRRFKRNPRHKREEGRFRDLSNFDIGLLVYDMEENLYFILIDPNSKKLDIKGVMKTEYIDDRTQMICCLNYGYGYSPVLFEAAMSYMYENDEFLLGGSEARAKLLFNYDNFDESKFTTKTRKAWEKFLINAQQNNLINLDIELGFSLKEPVNGLESSLERGVLFLESYAKFSHQSIETMNQRIIDDAEDYLNE